MRFQHSIALVTGASRGIGRDIALALAREGADVAVTATTPDGAADTAAAIRALGRRALALACRVERAADVTATFAAVLEGLGPVDLLVNNAGLSSPVPLLEMSEENWDQHMDVNAKSVFLCSHAAVRQMRDAGAFNIAQDEQTCVVYGMPREAVAAGGVHESLPLGRIAARLLEQLQSAGSVLNRV